MRICTITSCSMTICAISIHMNTYVKIYGIILMELIIIMVIFKCYISGEHIALSLKNNNGVNIELGKTNRIKPLCMMQINT